MDLVRDPYTGQMVDRRTGLPMEAAPGNVTPERVNYMDRLLNGTGVSERIMAVHQLFNPVTALAEAGQQSQVMFDPATTPLGRVAALGGMLTGMAGTVAPMWAASRGAVPTANAMVDAMTGINMPGGEFLADEFGGVKMPGKDGITAYHGSPHSFDKFSMDKIGTGEGNQNQGWGLYFAGRKNDAQYYADTYGGETGQMYKVKIGASPKEFLDWSTNVGDMPKAMQDKIRALSGESVPPDTPGRKAYAMIKERLGSDEAASKALRAADVPGVKYGTHGMGQDYVVFDENLIEIVRKYGIAGAAAMLGVTAMDVEQAMAGAP